LKLGPPRNLHGFLYAPEAYLREHIAMKIFQKFVIIIDSISEWTGKIFSFLTLALTFVVVYDVAMRYLLNRPTEWGLELNGFLLLAIGFLGGGYALLNDAHVKVTILHERFTPRVKAIVDLVTYLLFFIVCIVLLWYGSHVAWDSLVHDTRTPSTWGPPMWPSQMLIPIGAVLIGLQGLAKWIRDFYMAVKGVELDGIALKK
jgi:TRAP-type mannitol/chloroaromatic compound transport system permease small subunit